MAVSTLTCQQDRSAITIMKTKRIFSLICLSIKKNGMVMIKNWFTQGWFN